MPGRKARTRAPGWALLIPSVRRSGDRHDHRHDIATLSALTATAPPLGRVPGRLLADLCRCCGGGHGGADRARSGARWEVALQLAFQVAPQVALQLAFQVALQVASTGRVGRAKSQLRAGGQGVPGAPTTSLWRPFRANPGSRSRPESRPGSPSGARPESRPGSSPGSLRTSSRGPTKPQISLTISEGPARRLLPWTAPRRGSRRPAWLAQGL